MDQIDNFPSSEDSSDEPTSEYLLSDRTDEPTKEQIAIVTQEVQASDFDLSHSFTEDEHLDEKPVKFATAGFTLNQRRLTGAVIGVFSLFVLGILGTKVLSAETTAEIEQANVQKELEREEADQTQESLSTSFATANIRDNQSEKNIKKPILSKEPTRQSTSGETTVTLRKTTTTLIKDGTTSTSTGQTTETSLPPTTTETTDKPTTSKTSLPPTTTETTDKPTTTKTSLPPTTTETTDKPTTTKTTINPEPPKTRPTLIEINDLLNKIR